MNRKTLQEAMRLTQECLARYWQLDPEYTLNYCDDDVVWVGSLQSQFMEGKDAVTQDLRNSMQEIKPCHLLAQEFLIVQNTGNSCTIVGRYLTTTDDDVEYFLQVQQRCTFVWKQTGDGLKIKHIHVSNPMGELKVAEGELFVNEMGKMAREYLLKHIRTLQDKEQIVVTDENKIIHFLMLSEVVYVDANGRGCIIHTVRGEKVNAYISITDFLTTAGECFISVHRSYVINKAYISRIKKYEIDMLDGSRIPIPIKKYKEVREILTGLHDIVTE